MTGPEDLSPGIPASTLIAFRNGSDGTEILMIRRSQKLVFGGGAAVFPGGRVDPADRDLAAGMAGDAEWNVARVAAVRETLEETGLLVGVDGPVDAAQAVQARADLCAGKSFADVLDSLGLCIDADALVPFARWFPPQNIPRRFDTRFLIADLGTGAVDLSADGSETTEHFWITPEAMLARQDSDEEHLMFPTRMNLMRVAALGSFENAREQALAIPPRTIMPELEARDGDRFLVMPEGYGYPRFEQAVSTMRRY
ncbi:NUDIX hydrolase [Croceicoccus gelatinilyticus]|uniref:NUDIX hydrolase n=1 Tax=Croceicoccus gelatinilyticus TaxID=2835536 RepID=UPI001BCD1A08|nr:NUDIX domain-containing protein [Croceicoccus gelatinilyticus]MBS7670323.1 NUDIX domain-containing protein [Croceicoccus gelatinilyticus]